MILLQLFLSFFEIGAVSFGGGYAMIPLIREKCLAHGWLTDEALINLIAVSESTPGPIAVNCATFVGSTQAGIPGALAATLGVVLPSFLVILAIAALMRGLLKKRGVQTFLGGVRPVVVGLILAAGTTLLLSVLGGMTALTEGFSLDWKGLLILLLLAAAAFGYKKWKKKSVSPILLILVSAVLGIGMYG